MVQDIWNWKRCWPKQEAAQLLKLTQSGLLFHYLCGNIRTSGHLSKYDKIAASPRSKDIKVKKDVFFINTNLSTKDQLSSDNFSEQEDIDEPEEGCEHCNNKKSKKLSLK